jgi:two-component system response regulator GlrR
VAASLENQEMIIPSFDEARTEFEKRYLTKLLRITEGNVTHAARIADRNRTDFYKLLKKHSIVASDYKVSHNAENSNNKSASQNARKAS